MKYTRNSLLKKTAAPAIGRYSLLQELGRGTYGTVYKALNMDSLEVVAIKQVGYTEVDEDDRRHYNVHALREIDIMLNLPPHENIVTMLTHFAGTDEMFVNMVFPVYSMDMYDFLRTLGSNKNNQFFHVLYPNFMMTGWQIIKQLLAGLAHLHQAGVLHRDIKPANVLIDMSNKTLCFTDFGLSRYAGKLDSTLSVPPAKDEKKRVFPADGAEKLPMTGNVCTIWYRPPELVFSPTNYDAYDESVDVWSLGCTLYELFSFENKPLFPATDEPNLRQMLSVAFEEQIPALDFVAEKWKSCFNMCEKQDISSVFMLQHLRKRFVDIKDGERVLQLLSEMLAFDPARRTKPATLLGLDLFKNI